MSDFLVLYLDSIDERLLEYLDEDDELKLDAVKRLRFYTSALLEGSITPDHIVEDWPDWYQLVPTFVVTYGSEELQELEVAAELLEEIEEQDDVSLTEADWVRAAGFGPTRESPVPSDLPTSPGCRHGASPDTDSQWLACSGRRTSLNC